MQRDVLDISSYANEGGTLSDSALRRRGQRVVDLSRASTLNCARSQLCSLVCEPAGGQLASLAAQLTTLVAAHNRLRDLSGVEAFRSLRVLDASHNELRDLDPARLAPLARLQHLESLNLSYNNLCTFDLGGDAAVGASVSSLPSATATSAASAAAAATATATAAPPVLPLVSLDLSHNALHEVPDVRCMHRLEELNLDYNYVRDVANVESRVPLLPLRALGLAFNGLATAAALVPLAALADTLESVSLYGNPVTLEADDRALVEESGGGDDTIVIFASPQNASPTNRPSLGDSHVQGRRSRHNSAVMPPPPHQWWWRPLLLWLCPLLRATDGVAFSQPEQQAAQRLFRERGALQSSLLELMNPQRSEDLEVYMYRATTGVAYPPELPERARRRRSLLDAKAAEEAALLAAARHGQQRGGGGREAPAGSQTYASGSLADSRASTGTSANCVRLEEPLARAQQPRGVSESHSTGAGGSRALPLADVVRAVQRKLKSLSDEVDRLQLEQRETQARVAAAPAAGVQGGEALSDVLGAMRQLQTLMTTVFADLAECRRSLDRERARAAVVIQRHYRGHAARRRWRVVQREFAAFKQTVEPGVRVLQRAGRAMAARRRLAAAHERRRDRAELAALRAELDELRRLVQQHLLHPGGGGGGGAAAAPSPGTPQRTDAAPRVVSPAEPSSSPAAPAQTPAPVTAAAAEAVNSPDASPAAPARKPLPVMHSRPPSKSRSSAAATAAQQAMPPPNDLDEL